MNSSFASNIVAEVVVMPGRAEAVGVNLLGGGRAVWGVTDLLLLYHMSKWCRQNQCPLFHWKELSRTQVLLVGGALS